MVLKVYFLDPYGIIHR